MASILRRLELTWPMLRARHPQGRSAHQSLHKTALARTASLNFASLANRTDLA